MVPFFALPLVLLAAKPIALDVDLTEAPRHIFHAKLVIPVKPGPLSLAYPKWIPGDHRPSGPISDLAGVVIEANGKRLEWRRDPLEMWRLKVVVPAGTDSLSVSIDYLCPPSEAGSPANVDPDLVLLDWNTVLLYPEGPASLALPFQASVTLPAGWKLASALPIEAAANGHTRFATVSLETLVDSPLLAGEHFWEWPLGTVNGAATFLDVAADSEKALVVPPARIAAFGRMVQEANALFGAHHYSSYRFLTTLSDQMSGEGLEHHESSDDGTFEAGLIEDGMWRVVAADLFAHEMTHSWNGKYRRPAGLITGDFLKPQQTDLLWVYEGLTEYWGEVVAARAGAWTPEYFRDNLALVVEQLSAHTGREWRPLRDTADAASILRGGRREWSGWRRGQDYYDEGVLIWLEADARIREKTGDKKSLDDFARSFFGGSSGAPQVKAYDFKAVTRSLGEIAPDEWSARFTRQLDGTSSQPPLDGLALSGWRLAWADTASTAQIDLEKAYKFVGLSSSVGFFVDEKGELADVVRGRPADKAGIAPGSVIVAVNGRKFTPERLRDAVEASRTTPVELILSNAEFFRTVRLDWNGGGHYPRLERIPEKPDRLSAILAPRAAP